MMEHELKFYVPEFSLARLEKIFQTGHAKQQQFRALYFDTTTRQLAQQHVALRLRHEGHRWVQTLKMPTGFMLSRQEISHPRDRPEIDLTLYKGTPAQDLFDELDEPLLLRFEAHISRRIRIEKHADGLLEIALDQGYLEAGGLHLPVRELEIERQQGAQDLLYDSARDWQRQHDLILDLRSKAERGDGLAELARTLSHIAPGEEAMALAQQAVRDFWPVRFAQAVALNSSMTPQQALACIMSECLQHISRNSALLAGVDAGHGADAHADELVHQLRVGIRRLRSAWALFKGLSVLPDAKRRQTIKRLFAQLGAAREAHVLWQKLWPVLEAAGQPPLTLAQVTEPVALDAVLRHPSCQSWQIEMLRFVEKSQLEPVRNVSRDQPEKVLKKQLRHKLRQWHQAMLRDGCRFDVLRETQQHALRKKLKRLRYALQFSDALLPKQGIKTYLKQLAELQDQLGDMNDWVEAKNRLIGMRQDQPQAQFSIDWITALLAQTQMRVSSRFKRLARSASYWR
jgi:inorganic triphosphatase YgiF